MKSILTVVLLLALTVLSSGQSQTTASQKSAADYLKKSKRQKTITSVLVSSGGLLATAGVVVGLSEAGGDISNLFADEPQKSSDIGSVLFFSGLASIAGSIPFFIASSKNKKKAANLSAAFKIENRSVVQKNSIITSGYPALAVTFML